MTDLKGFIIAIDEGHGGNDPGAIDLLNTTEGDFIATLEKELNRKVGEKVIKKLKDLQATVISTRENDSTVSLYNRCLKANNANADMFISIHFNAGTSIASGIETFIHPEATNPLTKSLWKNLQLELINATGLKNRGNKTANYYVLRCTDMTAALVELGFITNSKEEKIINTDEFQEKVANAIITAILKSLGKEVV